MTPQEAREILAIYRFNLIQSMSNQLEGDIEALDMAIKVLEQQPKIGHWEYVQYDYNPDIGNWHCSECRNIVIECANKNEKGGIPKYNFCPNCGADMRGEEE